MNGDNNTVLWDEFFDPEGENPLNLTEDEQKRLRVAITDFNYNELFLPLYRRYEDLEKRMNHYFYTVIIVLLIVIAALLMNFFW